ncbi:hypothetical protein B0H11DRAFT_2093438 [Mycena galericulata]|nr:hypothetical protein B0H11DRAFT_2093438 [Mycena galericulata]
MHRALRIPEIVSMISRELVSFPERAFHHNNSDTAQTLAAVARTCKAFQDPALDLLWAPQNTVMKILDCMPGDIWEETDEGDTAELEVRLKRPVLPSDWERPLFYSRRVKFFTFDAHTFPAGSEFYETLGMCWPGGYFFPNIEGVEWDSSDPAMFPHVRLVVGPRLTSLTLGLCQSTAHLSLLPTLATQCPLLEDVIIYCAKDLTGRLESVSRFVTASTHLRTLYVPCLDRTALEHIVTLPNFVSLELSDQSPLPPSFAFLAKSELPSPALEDLDMTQTDVRAAIDVLNSLSHPSLDRLTLAFPKESPPPVASAIVEFYNAAAMNCDVDSLSSLVIGYPGFTERTPDQGQIALYTISGTQLCPLFVFSNLTSVNLAGPVGLDLDDAVATNMARAWPRIRSIELGTSTFTPVPPRTTLRALLSFAQCCPRLWHLHLSFDATVLPELELQPGKKRPQQKCLTDLGVMFSPVNAPLAVAAFLSSVFPKLQRLHTDREHRENQGAVLDMHRKWKAAEAALPVLRTVRAEERYWTKHGGK